MATLQALMSLLSVTPKADEPTTLCSLQDMPLQPSEELELVSLLLRMKYFSAIHGFESRCWAFFFF